MVVKCGDRLADTLTTALPQGNFERSWSQMLQLPVFHPLSAVMRLEPCQFFEYDADSQQYKSSFMGVQSEATAYLTTIHAQGTRLHLVDSGSSVFTSPHKDTLILPIKTNLKLTGVGGANSEFMSSLIYILCLMFTEDTLCCITRQFTIFLRYRWCYLQQARLSSRDGLFT